LAAQRFLRAATIFARPSGDKVRLAFFAGFASFTTAGFAAGVAAVAAGALLFTFAHLAFWAAAILAFPAADIPLRVFFTGNSGDIAGRALPPVNFASWDSSEAIFSLIDMTCLSCSIDMVCRFMRSPK